MFVVLVNVPVILFDATAFVNPPVIPVPVGALQVYVVPVGITPFVPSVGVAVNVTPLHVVVLIAVTAAFGLIVTVTVKVLPVYMPDTGVTI
jgi:hypothetical protein